MALSNCICLDDANRSLRTRYGRLSRTVANKTRLRPASGLSFSIAAILISLTYLIEIEAVCLIDVLTGDRVRLMAEALQSEIEYMEMMGLPIPDTADDPACLNTTHNLLP